MIDLRTNSAHTMIVEFADGSNVTLIGADAEKIWRLMDDREIIQEVYTTTGRYQEPLFTAPVAILPRLGLN